MSTVRAVLDTNVIIAAHRSSGLASPNREILSRWKAGDFTLLYSEDVLLEYVEKLIALGVPDEKLREFVRAVGVLGERVAIVFFHLRRYPRMQTTSRFYSAPSMATPPIWLPTTAAFQRSRQIARSPSANRSPFSLCCEKRL